MKAQEYLSQGYEICNALIENAEISTTEGPAVSITLKLPMGGVCWATCYGTYKPERDEIVGWEAGMTILFRIMKIAGVTAWSKLRNQPVRAVLKDHRIYAIGHFLYDEFVDYRTYPTPDEKGA
jgi:hypothetical protein